MAALRKEMRGDRPERGERAERGEKGERAEKGERTERRERERLHPGARLERLEKRSAFRSEGAPEVRTALAPLYEPKPESPQPTAHNLPMGKECCRTRECPGE